MSFESFEDQLRNDIVFQRAIARSKEAALPIVAGSLLPRDVMIMQARLEVGKHDAEIISQNDSSYLLNRTTMAAPIVHGIAPKTIEKATRRVGTALLVEDDNRDLMFLNLYNYVLENENPREIFPVGSFLAILQPYLRFSLDDPRQAVHIRCDNPQAIRVFDNELQWKNAKNKIFKVPKNNPQEPNRGEDLATALCEAENELFTKGAFKKCIQLYSEGLLLSSSPASVNIRLLSNRAAAYLKIENFSAAEQDCRAVLAVDSSHSKCRYRMALALLLQQRPLEAMTYIDSVTTADLLDTKTLSEKEMKALQREQTCAQIMQEDIKRAISETVGVYNMKELMNESKTEAGISKKHMNYQSPLIRLQNNIPKKGRGFIATTSIPAGQLVIASKALVMTPAMDSMAGMKTMTTEFSAKSNMYTTGAQLLPIVIRQLILHPELGPELYSLTAGRSYMEPVMEEHYDRVDLKRLSCILKSNCFTAYTDNLRKFIDAPVGTNKLAEVDSCSSSTLAGRGLWIKPSFFNHSCLPNCDYTIIGDFMFIVTNRTIAEGDELTISYCDVRKSFPERREIFDRWNESEGFTCMCSRCEFDRAHPEVLAAEATVQSAYETGVDLCSQGMDMGRAADQIMPPVKRKALLSLLEKQPLEGKRVLCELYDIITMSHLTADRLKEALASVKQCIEVERALFGVSSPGSPFLLKAEFRLMTISLALRIDCMVELKTVFNRVCCPPSGLYSRAEFLTLSKRYIAVNNYDQFCTMVQLLDDSKANCVDIEATTSSSNSNSSVSSPPNKNANNNKKNTTRKGRKGKK